MKAALRNLLFFVIALAFLWGIGSVIAGKYKKTSQHIRVGNMNGVPLEIPVSYLWRGVEYADKSIWEGRKPGDKRLSERTFDDAISAFNLYVKWPGLTPEQFDGQGNTRNYTNSDGHPWILIGINSDYAINPRPPNTPKNGLARVLAGKIIRLARNTHTVYNPALRKAERIKGMHYELRGNDPATGLQHAVPVGPSTERLSGSNRTLYWRGDRDRSVDVLIECANGVTHNPRVFYRCRHVYQLPEIGAYVAVNYTRNWVPFWREIQEKTRILILTFQADENPMNDESYSKRQDSNL